MRLPLLTVGRTCDCLVAEQQHQQAHNTPSRRVSWHPCKVVGAFQDVVHEIHNRSCPPVGRPVPRQRSITPHVAAKYEIHSEYTAAAAAVYVPVYNHHVDRHCTWYRTVGHHRTRGIYLCKYMPLASFPCTIMKNSTQRAELVGSRKSTKYCRIRWRRTMELRGFNHL